MAQDRNISIRLAFALAVLLVSFDGHAEQSNEPKVQVMTPDWISQESVTIKTKVPNAVLNRNISMKNRFSAQVGYGAVLDEVYFNKAISELRLGYSISDRWGFGLVLRNYGQGLGEYSTQIRSTAGTLLNLVPQPTQSHGLVVNQELFYGKWSWNQNFFMNTIINGVYEVSMASFNNYSSQPMASVGISQMTYFNRNWALGFRYDLWYRRVIDANSLDLKGSSPVNVQEFGTMMKLNEALTANFSYTF